MVRHESDCLRRNIENVLERVRSASGGRKVTVVAATKTVGAELIGEAVALGITDIGENRVQEYLCKRDAVSGAVWHFIGALQRNKAKYLVGEVALIQSVSGLSLGEEIDRLAIKRGVVQDVLVEVNIGGEAAKAGVDPALADELISRLCEKKGIRVRGLMAVPPRDADESVYKKLYSLFDAHRGNGFDILSVGMSGDFETAIANGSNMVRIGSAFFGPRLYQEGVYGKR